VVHVPDPGPGEALVAVQACGVCHTDLHYREGGIGDQFPYLLGLVVLNWRAVCGRCRACRRGEPWYCFETHNAAQPMTLADGTPLSPALGIGAGAEKTLVHSGQCTKVDPTVAPEVAGLLGCGVMAGTGATLNTAGVRRGQSVAVIGGGGDAAIAGAVLAGATRIIGVDVDPQKLDWAKDFGATHTVDARTADVVEAIRELTGSSGADVVIDAVGRPKTWEQGFYPRDLAGTLVLVGVPMPELTVPPIPLVDVFGRGGSLTSSWYGDCVPARDFPMLVELHLQGRFPLERFVSERIGLAAVEEAFHRMESGAVLRSVVVL